VPPVPLDPCVLREPPVPAPALPPLSEPLLGVPVSTPDVLEPPVPVLALEPLLPLAEPVLLLVLLDERDGAIDDPVPDVEPDVVPRFDDDDPLWSRPAEPPVLFPALFPVPDVPVPYVPVPVPFGTVAP